MRLYVSILVIGLLCSWQSPAQRLRFNAPQGYPAAGPTGLQGADLNGDGNPDVVTVNPGNGRLAVLLGNGHGGFGPSRTYNIPGAHSVVIGDFNGDGKPDLVVAGNNADQDQLTLLIGAGDGTFTPGPTIPLAQVVSSMIAADFNGDGKLDLAIPANTGVSILLGNGDGAFQSALTYPLGGRPTVLATADFNRDGHPDLAAIGAEKHTIDILLGRGDGTFTLAPPVNAGQFLNYICAADFNGDGLADLAVTDPVKHTVHILLGDGTGAFSREASYKYYDRPAGSDFVMAADLSGKGVMDLIVTVPEFRSIAILAGNGDGTFQRFHLAVAGSGANSIFAADLNHDGRIDFAIANQASSDIEVLLGAGDGRFVPRSVMYSSGNSEGGALTADFNHDGHPDVAIAGGGKINVLLSNGTGFQQPAIYSLGAVNYGPWGLVMSDFNGDGNLDLAVCFGDPSNGIPGTVSVLLGNSGGTFQAPVTSPAGPQPFAIVAGDFNGDGKPDLVLSDTYAVSAGSTYLALGNGDGTFALPVTTLNKTGTLAAGDFNGDGNLDLAIVTGATLRILIGDGLGAFQPGQTYSFGFDQGGKYNIVAADLNHDGALDLVILTQISKVAVMFGKGDGTFASPTEYVVPQANTITVADVNGDGNPDVLVGTNVNTAIVLLGNGKGQFQTGLEWLIPGQVGGILAGDFSGAGRMDLAVPIQQGGMALLANIAR